MLINDYSSYLNGQLQCDLFTASECQKIIRESVTSEPETGRIGTDAANKKSTRDVKVRFINPRTKQNLWFSQRILKAGLMANQQYFKFKVDELSLMQLLEYGEGEHYDWHVDMGVAGPEATRKLTLVTFLSDPASYDGGDLIWFPQYLIKPDRIFPKQGSMVIFPSFQAHKVEPVTRGTRYTLVGWLHGRTSFA